MLNRIIEVTFVLIILYLVVANAAGFAQAIRAIGGVYTDSVKALQAR